ncbi:type III secretion system effector phosphothreonine lyase [Pseudomonas fluorescens]|uniref:MAPK phosphothreonine lyase n=1 Tax=Pseudomonas fluorescens TaxID=294 RepID=A0A5E7MSM8_PSEFL|nr:type III secretion system effector phosphothreonine lyase [Pseudomonas fluorescens]VVP27814.1 MAPK phosphothreonine lyase [Pseudomonas fluorescens]
MPIKSRPAPLKLTQLKLNVLDAATPQSTHRYLNSNFESLIHQMRIEPVPDFKHASHAPDYCNILRSGFNDRHNNFMLNNSGEDVFIHARREPAQCTGPFDGDKFHLSIKPDEVPEAFDALRGLLFSDDSPIDQWKVTDMERAEPASRVSEGTQFTLYVKLDLASEQNLVQELRRVRHFVECMESLLTESNIQPGQYPDSDIRPSSWQYVSYRNELRSQREGSEAQNQMLRSEPFYRLVTE